MEGLGVNLDSRCPAINSLERVGEISGGRRA